MKIMRVAAVAALFASGAALAHPHEKADTSVSNPDKVVCKRLVETGSLVKGSRTCKTRAAWARDAEEGRKKVQEIQDSTLINSSRPN